MFIEIGWKLMAAIIVCAFFTTIVNIHSYKDTNDEESD